MSFQFSTSAGTSSAIDLFNRLVGSLQTSRIIEQYQIKENAREEESRINLKAGLVDLVNFQYITLACRPSHMHFEESLLQSISHP